MYRLLSNSKPDEVSTPALARSETTSSPPLAPFYGSLSPIAVPFRKAPRLQAPEKRFILSAFVISFSSSYFVISFRISSAVGFRDP